MLHDHVIDQKSSYAYKINDIGEDSIPMQQAAELNRPITENHTKYIIATAKSDLTDLLTNHTLSSR